MRIRRIFDWITNLLFWGAIVFIGVSYGLDLSSSLKSVSIILAALFGLIYYGNTFICSYCSYLSNQMKMDKAYDSLDRAFKKPPRILMGIECYHYTKSRKSGNNRGGRGRNKSNFRSSTGGKVVTHKAWEDFHYRSWRDISGEFKLDISEASRNEDVCFLLLDLSVEAHYANDGTSEDHQRKKHDFIVRNLRRDRCRRFYEQHTVEGLQPTAMVQLTDSLPCCFGLCYFVIFGLLSFNAIYSTYLDSYCHRQSFVIKKVVSTRTDLQANELQSQYAYYDPRFVLQKQVITFAPVQAPQIIYIGPQVPGSNIASPVTWVAPTAPTVVPFIAAKKDDEIEEEPDATDTTQGPLNQSASTMGTPYPGVQQNMSMNMSLNPSMVQNQIPMMNQGPVPYMPTYAQPQ